MLTKCQTLRDDGMLIQDLDIADVSSERRNPILANVMAQLDYMEKRGSGLTRICNETKALDGYKDELKISNYHLCLFRHPECRRP